MVVDDKSNRRDGLVGVVFIRADDEAVEGPAVVGKHCCWTVPHGDGADGVAAGQSRRSANAERDLRSCPAIEND